MMHVLKNDVKQYAPIPMILIVKPTSDTGKTGLISFLIKASCIVLNVQIYKSFLFFRN